MSLKSQIYDFVAKNGLTHGGRLEDYARTLGYKASNASRRCRELVNLGKFKPVYNEKHEVQYICTEDTEDKPWWLDPKIDPRLEKPKTPELATRLF